MFTANCSRNRIFVKGNEPWVTYIRYICNQWCNSEWSKQKKSLICQFGNCFGVWQCLTSHTRTLKKLNRNCLIIQLLVIFIIFSTSLSAIFSQTAMQLRWKSKNIGSKFEEKIRHKFYRDWHTKWK